MVLIVAKPRAQSATIKVHNINQTLVPVAQSPISLDTVQPGITRLDQLSDVNEGTPVDKATLVYNTSTHKFDVGLITLDGGVF